MIQLLDPNNGKEVPLMRKIHADFRKNPTVEPNNEFDPLNLKQESEDLSSPEPIVLSYLPNIDGIVYLSTNPNMADAKSIHGHNGKASVINLLIGTDYYWYVEIDNQHSEIGHFRTDSTTPRLLHIDGITNVRDLGGFPTVNKRKIRQCMLYRTSELDKHVQITPAGINELLSLGIKTDLDFRRATETQGPVLDESKVKWYNFPISPYAEIFEDISTKEQYLKSFKLLCDESNYPMFVHCWGGMDRTGCWLFILGAALGADEEDLTVDYEFSSFSLWGRRSRNSDLFVGFRDGLRKYGDNVHDAAVNYLLECGLTSDELEKIRSILLEK